VDSVNDKLRTLLLDCKASENKFSYFWKAVVQPQVLIYNVL